MSENTNEVSKPASLAKPDRRHLAPLDLSVLEKMRERDHATCLACSTPMFRLEFEAGQSQDDQRIQKLISRFTPTAGHCSYQGVVHGGVVALLNDEAMTCCLMAHGLTGVTGELNLRYLQTVEVSEIELTTWVTKAYAPLYQLQCELHQNGELRVRATAKFMKKS